MKALVTGASRGLGTEILKQFEVYYDTVGVSRTSNNKQNEIKADIANLAAYEEYLDGCDILINNAAVVDDLPLAVQRRTVIQDMLLTNLEMPIVITREWVRRRVINGRGGVCINVSSVCALQGYSGLAAYSATKAGLIGFTQSMAREMGSKGFRFNAVAPGFLETDMSSRLTDENKQKILKRTPIGRFARISEVARLVLHLVENEAINGQTIVIDGGHSV